jgi:predicted nucleic acid-binding protein
VAVPERHESGVLDTCTYLDLNVLSPEVLPKVPEITAVTLAELHQGVAMAQDGAVRAARVEQLGAALVGFDALPFNEEAAARYGTMVSLALAAGRQPRPRRMDLLIAAIASVHDLPLYTRNADDFTGLERAVTVVPV